VFNKARNSENELHEKFKAEKTVADQFHFLAVLRIRDVYPGSKFFYPRSRVHKKEFKYFEPGIRIPDVHPGSGSRIRILILKQFRIPDPGVTRAPDSGSGSAPLLPSNGKKLFAYVPVLPVELLLSLPHVLHHALQHSRVHLPTRPLQLQQQVNTVAV
jgi:hypothetical protein